MTETFPTPQPAHATVERQFEVASEKVFDAWLDADRLAQWMFGPNVRDEEIVRLTIDPKVGGRFSYVVNRNGSEIDHIGEYRAIERPDKLIFTWSVAPDPIDSSLVAIDISSLGVGCKLTLVHQLQPDWAHFVDRVAGSWNKMLEALARHVEN